MLISEFPADGSDLLDNSASEDILNMCRCVRPRDFLNKSILLTRIQFRLCSKLVISLKSLLADNDWSEIVLQQFLPFLKSFTRQHKEWSDQQDVNDLETVFLFGINEVKAAVCLTSHHCYTTVYFTAFNDENLM